MKYKIIIPIGLILILVIGIVFSQGRTPIPERDFTCSYDDSNKKLYCRFTNNFDCVGMEVTHGVPNIAFARDIAQYIYERCVAGTIVVTTTTLPPANNETVRAYE